MATIRIHRYGVNPEDLDEFTARRHADDGDIIDEQ
jgi:hypothetical protein